MQVDLLIIILWRSRSFGHTGVSVSGYDGLFYCKKHSSTKGKITAFLQSLCALVFNWSTDLWGRDRYIIEYAELLWIEGHSFYVWYIDFIYTTHTISSFSHVNDISHSHLLATTIVLCILLFIFSLDLIKIWIGIKSE